MYCIKEKNICWIKKGQKLGIERRHIVLAFVYYLFSSMWKTAWNVSITLKFQIKTHTHIKQLYLIKVCPIILFYMCNRINAADSLWRFFFQIMKNVCIQAINRKILEKEHITRTEEKWWRWDSPSVMRVANVDVKRSTGARIARALGKELWSMVFGSRLGMADHFVKMAPSF